MPEKCGKNEGENHFFPTLVFDSKTRSQFKPSCKKIREKSLVIKLEGFFGLWEGQKAGTGEGNGIRRGGNGL